MIVPELDFVEVAAVYSRFQSMYFHLEKIVVAETS